MTVIQLKDARREREARIIGLASAITAFFNHHNALYRLYAGLPPDILEWGLSIARSKELLERHYRTVLAYEAAVARGEVGDPPLGFTQRKSDARFHDEALEWARRILADDFYAPLVKEASDG